MVEFGSKGVKPKNDLEYSDFRSKLTPNYLQIQWIFEKEINTMSAHKSKAYYIIKVK
jgi:hypothetical protein